MQRYTIKFPKRAGFVSEDEALEASSDLEAVVRTLKRYPQYVDNVEIWKEDVQVLGRRTRRHAAHVSQCRAS